MTEVKAIPDLRHWLAKRGFGAAFLIIRIHARLDDFEGAILGNQHALAVDVAREIVVDCAYIRAFDRIGPLPRSGIEWWLSAEPLEHLDDRSADLLRQICLPVTQDGLVPIETGLRALVAETEALLDVPVALPIVRDRNGYFPALRLAREWLALVESVDLPPIMKKEWLSS